MDLAQFQFLILAVVVAMAAYVGAVSREVSKKIGERLKARKSPNPDLQKTLWSLIVGDIFLILIANLTALRILLWGLGKPVPIKIDQALVVLIYVTILYMSVLHGFQWASFAKRASAKGSLQDENLRDEDA